MGSPRTRSSFLFLHLPPQFMDISCFPMKNLPNNPLTTHIQKHQLFTPVIDIFQHHAMFFGTFRGVYDIPHLIQSDSDRYFYQSVCSFFHGFYGHGSMVGPIGCNKYHIRFHLLQHEFPLVLVSPILSHLISSFLSRYFFYPIGFLFDQILINITNSSYFGTRQ